MRSVDRSVLTSFWTIAAAGVAVTAINFLDRFESDLFPVVSNMQVTEIDQLDRSIRLSGTMQVNRACRLEEVLLYTGDGREPEVERERLRLRVIDDPVDLSEGEFRWGPWEIARPQFVAGPHLVARMTHRCHPLFDTTGIALLLDATVIFTQPEPR
jgi:hypothetical protein